ncbi:MerC domain-containing protein [Niabella hibiscisoli]|uniref:MerC domain-containing protein n=1 Tax=Niabella hibiscisoli TaxID=1825928 RepID=UPI001F0DC8D9|nr:MerC domain-containing protein [Niabella hibiscisoli]MCH5715777.1 MerC domain-containing protein [Niabella hibiscisoli]
MRNRINWDALGITTSILCAIHCAVLPLFLAALPMFGVDIIENLAFEIGMIVLAFVIGCYALWHGYKWHHHSKTPLVLFQLALLSWCSNRFFLIIIPSC